MYMCVLSKTLKAETHDATNRCDTSPRQNKGKRLVAATVQTRRLVASRVSALKLAGGLSHILSYCKVNNIEFNFVLQYLLKYTQKNTIAKCNMLKKEKKKEKKVQFVTERNPKSYLWLDVDVY